MLEAHGWEFALSAVLDEGEIEDCAAILGHRRGADTSEGGEIERLHATPTGDDAETEDAEALARWDGWVYLFGSHFGSKSGSLQPKRGFVARFREADVGHATDDPAVEVGISRRSFALHRLINDAFKAHGPDLIPLGSNSYETLIEGTIKQGAQEHEEWSGLVLEGDYPINIEGTVFRPDGTLLLGLRIPTAADGRPILIELKGVERLFEPGDRLPEVRGFWVVDAIGRNGEMAGVRYLATLGDELHLITGNIDSRDGQSVLIQDYLGGRETVATHFRCTLPPDEHSGSL